jgi:hypothetical protein
MNSIEVTNAIGTALVIAGIILKLMAIWMKNC